MRVDGRELAEQAYRRYRAGLIGRREFLRRVGAVGVTATGVRAVFGDSQPPGATASLTPPSEVAAAGVPPGAVYYISNGKEDSRTLVPPPVNIEGRVADNIGRSEALLNEFRLGLREHSGLVEGPGLSLRPSWGEGTVDGLTAAIQLAHEMWGERRLIERGVFVMQDSRFGRAFNTMGIAYDQRPPIVAAHIENPVYKGRVNSIQQPGKNLTGVLGWSRGQLWGQWEILMELVPSVTRVGFVRAVDRFDGAENPAAKHELEEAMMIARAFGVELVDIPVGESNDPGGPQHNIEAALRSVSPGAMDGIVVSSNHMFDLHVRTVVGVIHDLRLPAVYGDRDYVARGGLAGWGVSRHGRTKQAAELAGMYLTGTPIGDIPMAIPGPIDFALNQDAANGLPVHVETDVLKYYTTHYYFDGMDLP